MVIFCSNGQDRKLKGVSESEYELTFFDMNKQRLFAFLHRSCDPSPKGDAACSFFPRRGTGTSKASKSGNPQRLQFSQYFMNCIVCYKSK